MFLRSDLVNSVCMLAVCHEHHLVHTDIKPENILFRDSSFDLRNDPTPIAARTVSSAKF